jgi:glycogen debranching enzyme
MDDIVQIDDRWYVLATSSRADDRTRVLKHGDTFGLFDRYGDIQHLGIGEQGLYHEGTRFLSHFELQVNGRRPLLLNSTVKEDNSLLVVDLTTPDIYENDALVIRKSTVHIFRSKLLCGGVHHEHVRVVNYGGNSVDLRLDFQAGTDFADIFEVRGVQRARRGKYLPAEHAAGMLSFGYKGLDHVTRYTRIVAEPAPAHCADGKISYTLQLAPAEQRDLYLTVTCEVGRARPTRLAYGVALQHVENEMARLARDTPAIATANEEFNQWLNRSNADLRMLATITEHGPYPYAGVPWYSTPFGRDGIITALQTLWLDPTFARGVLMFLAAHQADRECPEQDAEPGKILHEMRGGELAALKEVPFGCYYGSVDSTPLFVLLAGAYYERTGDAAIVEQLWPHIERALDWIDRYGDRDGDGFVEYARRNPNGLVHQGWKDSDDSVFHADGTLASAPIALCEVQAYVYGAKQAAARLARVLGKSDRADALESAATALKARFNRAFWSDELGTFVLALDGDKRPCRVAASNAGHALFSGIAEPSYALATAELLVSPVFFTGWGARTLARTERRYNPMSYHNGSIWPHDNGLIAMGMARYGLHGHVLKLLKGLFDASNAFELHRLPELFCGFERLPGQGPTLYPVACIPQAWASGAVFHLLQASLGLSFVAAKAPLRFDHPLLPDYLQWIEVKNLTVGDGELDLMVRRNNNDVGVSISRKVGDAEVTVIL